MEFNENQKKAIEFYEGCCNVIASAGSGKSSSLVHRIKNLVMKHNVDPNKILAITFSKKAKENMVNRLEKLLPDYYKYVHVETFHSFGYSIIRKFNRIGYQILDADWKKNKIVEDICKNLFRIKSIDGDLLVDYISYISFHKNKLQFPDKNSDNYYEQVYYYYEKYKRENNCLDFDDMLTLSYEILKENNKALEYCQNQYQFILADEMQDTNAAQYEIIRLLAKRHPNVFFVSDPLQAVYSWRGSDNKYILDFDNEWINPTTINLNCNYRCSKNIVNFANNFARTIPESNHKHYVESVSYKPEFKNPEYCCYIDEFDEANSIALKIKNMISTNNYAYNDFAILARTNAQLVNFEAAMHSHSVPYFIVDGIQFVDRKEIKIVLSYLKLSYDSSDNDAFSYIYNKPNRYLGKQFLEDTKKMAIKEKTSMFYAMNYVANKNKRYATGARELFDVVNCMNNMKFASVKDQIVFIRNRLKLDNYVMDEISDDNNSSDKIDNLNALTNIAGNYTSAKDFILYMSQLITKNKETDNAVKLMTIHKSKGLEYPVVFVVGVNDGLLPHRKNENIDEERRLMYVAITRAEKELFISSTNKYANKQASPSIFIDEMFC